MSHTMCSASHLWFPSSPVMSKTAHGRKPVVRLERACARLVRALPASKAVEHYMQHTIQLRHKQLVGLPVFYAVQPTLPPPCVFAYRTGGRGYPAVRFTAYHASRRLSTPLPQKKPGKNTSFSRRVNSHYGKASTWAPCLATTAGPP